MHCRDASRRGVAGTMKQHNAKQPMQKLSSGRLGRVGRRRHGHRGEEGGGGGVKPEAAATGRSWDGGKWAGLGSRVTAEVFV